MFSDIIMLSDNMLSYFFFLENITHSRGASALIFYLKKFEKILLSCKNPPQTWYALSYFIYKKGNVWPWLLIHSPQISWNISTNYLYLHNFSLVDSGKGTVSCGWRSCLINVQKITKKKLAHEKKNVGPITHTACRKMLNWSLYSNIAKWNLNYWIMNHDPFCPEDFVLMLAFFFAKNANIQ
jgi:hypothetical protein